MSLGETFHEADHDALPQPPRDGDRGAAALPPGRRRGADGRLRQDHARARHGRDQHEPAGDLPAGRADAARQLARAARSAAAATPGSTGRSCAPATISEARLAGDRGRHRALARPLHDDGHGLDDDVRSPRRSGCTLPGAVVDPGGRRQSLAHGRPHAAGASSRWSGRTCKPRDILTRAVVRQRDHRRCMALGGSTNAIIHLIAMAGRAGIDARRSSASTSSRARRRCSPTSGPSGEYLMEDFYYAGGLRGAARASSRDLLDLELLTVNGRTLGENIDGREGLQRRRDPPARQSARRAAAASRSCAATSRPTARSSSRPRPSRTCCSTPGRRSSSRDYNDLAARIDDPDARRRRRTRCSCCRTPARWAARACRSGACCRSRRSC